MIPMGLLYIGTVLEKEGYDVKVLDLLVSRYDQETVLKSIEKFNPQVVGITSVTMNWPDASRTLRWVKEADPTIVTVAGGPHVTFTWKEIGREESWVDYLVLGEGEKTVVELMAMLKNGKTVFPIAGLAWRDNGCLKAGPQRKFEVDVNALPKPARHLFPLSRYRAMHSSVGVTTGRGCPFSCIFCVGPKMVGHKPRLVNPTTVADQVEEAVKLGFRHINFSDDHFGMKRSHAMAVCDEIISRRIDVELSIFIRADAADRELLEKMKKAGCRGILYGAESGVQEIVNLIKKKTDLNMLKEKVKLALDIGLQVQVSFILGLPGESKETIQQTLDYAKGLDTFAGFHILAPLPGSEICERAEELELKILHRNWALYDADHVVTETPGLSAAELENVVANNDAYYNYLAEIEDTGWKKGELSGRHLEQVDRKRCMVFFFELCRNGFFEKEMCCIETPHGESPYDILVKNTAAAAKVEEDEARKWISRAMDLGDLRMVEEGAKTKFAFREEIQFPPLF